MTIDFTAHVYGGIQYPSSLTSSSAEMFAEAAADAEPVRDRGRNSPQDDIAHKEK